MSRHSLKPLALLVLLVAASTAQSQGRPDPAKLIAAIGAATAASICTSAGALQPHNTSSALQASSASAVSAAATLHSTSTLQ